MRSVSRGPLIFKTVMTGLFIAAALVFFSSADRARVNASASGPSPSFTDAPLESNCTVCHTTNPVNTGSGMLQITGIPAMHSPGQEIEITVTATKEDAVIYGFQLTAVDANGNTPGTFALPAETVPRTQVVSNTFDEITRQYAQHTIDGLTGSAFGSNSWTFKWTAPMAAGGPVNFYAAANAADGDGSPSGDFIYTASVVTQAETASISVSGRVFTSDGRGLRNAIVRLTDPHGIVRSVLTSSLGYYSFSDVASAQTYSLTVASKRYRFQPKSITPSQDLTEVDFIGQE